MVVPHGEDNLSHVCYLQHHDLELMTDNLQYGGMKIHVEPLSKERGRDEEQRIRKSREEKVGRWRFIDSHEQLVDRPFHQPKNLHAL